MLDQWIAEIVGNMWMRKITQKRLASEMGVTPEYVSAILNGHRAPRGAEERFREAIDNISAGGGDGQ